ncbi:MAG: phosphoglucosamine mutase [Coriobacteriia bacterium]|nr:phosphoglucosamine mutase [Coriobacteriia bacterium]
MAAIHFGTDGWRARQNGDFTEENVSRVAWACAEQFKQEESFKNAHAPYILLAYDTRPHADSFARLAAQVISGNGIEARLSDSYIPTPALCWSIAQDPNCIGGLMLTASHNPADYLGIKVRMEDGGASTKAFTDKIEALLPDKAVTQKGEVQSVSLMDAYLRKLKSSVDTQAILDAQLFVVHDAMYGASRQYVPALFESLGIKTHAIRQEKKADFGGIHPEPIFPWIQETKDELLKVGAQAALINDGDADRIGALDEFGNFVSPHKILTLLTLHLYNKGKRGRVVATSSGSSILKRAARDLGLSYTMRPIGFKYIYEEMLKGDVICGGEESGGIGVSEHVLERDGLLLDLILCEMMAKQQKSLSELVREIEDKYGKFYYSRYDLTLDDEVIERFKGALVDFELKEVAGSTVLTIDRRDGIRLDFEDDAWLLMRPSGTEPLVRIYAESLDKDEQERLVNWGREFAQNA